jgi:hypothetical protein
MKQTIAILNLLSTLSAAHLTGSLVHPIVLAGTSLPLILLKE